MTELVLVGVQFTVLDTRQSTAETIMASIVANIAGQQVCNKRRFSTI